ncbi:GNAT family N-acetyltransferase [Paenibacillus sp. MMS18-CY102]|uniref:GNAT family N-acetyltransferase n=1 Tax=Paenibacillus sp. MMS18-CY102 TaxID=2682849 RepID=UPI00136652E0|nr:GNAT family N-acetyltransferase [Paenibacillus sp. MMS18-CY102]MWC28609.1 GNAT family N-acetyltransferase [Paenibacillus sp. MMS18-CY102]
MNIMVRKANNTDLPLLAHMNKELIEDEGSRNPMTVAQLEGRMSGWLHSNWKIEIIQQDETIIGYAIYQLRTDELSPDESYVYLRQFYLLREYRGHGHGTLALNQLIHSSFPPGAKIAIDVLATNPRGHNFWRKFGFAPYYTRMNLKQD